MSVIIAPAGGGKPPKGVPPGAIDTRAGRCSPAGMVARVPELPRWAGGAGVVAVSARGKLPEHVRRALVARGVIERDGVTTTPSVRHCRACGAALVVALVDGVRASLAPRELTPLGEWQAIRAGRATYRVRADWVTWRPGSDIAAQPAGSVAVLASHRCGGDSFDYQPLPPRQARKRAPEPKPEITDPPF